MTASPSSAGFLSRVGARGSALRRWRLVLIAAWIGLVLFLVSPYAPWRLPGDPLPMRGRSAAPFDLAEGASHEVEVVLD